MIVVGIDPGTAATGYGLVVGGDGAGLQLVECGVIRSTRRRPLPERLREIFDGVSEVVERSEPDVLSVEGVFYGRNVRTAVTLAHARGVVLLAANTCGVPVVEYPPAEIKNMVVGSGAARKEQVAFMVQRHLGLEEPPTPSDAADGLAAALCHLFKNGASPGQGGRGAGVGRHLRS